nr:hypothetical protein [Tanacetum cinerariifolium]
TLGCGDEIEEMLEIKVYEMGGDEVLFTSEAWRHAFDINEPIYTELCHEFYVTNKFEEEFVTRLAKKIEVLTDEVLNGLSAPIYCRPLDATILRELIGSNGRLIAEDLASGVSRVAMPRTPRRLFRIYMTAWRYASV